MHWLVFSIISQVSFGISNAYWKTTGSSANFLPLAFVRGIIASIVFGLLWLCHDYIPALSGTVNSGATFTDYALTLGLCVVCSFGLLFYLLSLRHQPVSISIPITSANLFSILVIVFVIGEPFLPVYYAAIPMAIIGILLSQNFNFSNLQLKWNKGATLALIASFFWGISYPFFKFQVPKVGALPLSFILESCMAAVSLAMLGILKSPAAKERLTWQSLIKHGLILAGLLIGGTLSLNLALAEGTLLWLYLMNNLSIIVSISLGITLLQERISLRQGIGIGLIVSSILLPSLNKLW